ncbi:MAG: prepilin-type N-terminal cleavage/methylation domain-containing protein, partial [Candidatus Curtissbacteria bacterium]
MPIKVHSSQLAVHRTAKTINRRFNPKNRFGFTLLELLVALGLLTVTVGSALVFLTSVLRGSNQSAIVTEVKQNGQSVLDSLERQMRDATEARQMLAGELPLGATNGL